MPHDLPQPQHSTAMLPALTVLPGHLMWRAHARVLLVVAAQLPAGVDVHSYATLLALADGRPRSQQALAETTKVSRTTMAKVAAQLADEGLVERVRNPDDRRSWALTRTPGGADAVRRWERHVLAVEDALTGALTPDERADLRELLLRVVREEIPDDAPDELLASVGFLITRVHFRMHRDFLAGLEPLGLEPRHFGSLVALRELGPVPQAELARVLGVSPTSVVQIVDDLEGAGILERRRLPADRRAHELHLTARAPEVTTRASTVAADVAATRLDVLSPAETTRLLDLLHRFVTAAPG